jgi:hypothetical protein
VGVLIIFLVRSGLELKHMEKGKIELPWSVFFPPARQTYGRRFYWGGRGWMVLPKGYECFELKIRLSPQRRPLTRHTQERQMGPLFILAIEQKSGG